MVHIMAPRPANDVIPVFLNVDRNVGLRLGSSTEDILLVQFLIKSIANAGLDAASPQQREILRATPLSGVVDDATDKSIRTMQTVGRDPVDGIVSTARGYRYGSNFWTIVRLSRSFAARFSNIYPRLDLAPGCPPALGQAVRRALVGSA